MQIISQYSKRAVEISLELYRYSNNNLGIKMWCQGGLYANVTINVENKLLNDEAFIDINNFPEVQDFIIKYGLGEQTGDLYQSDDYLYPLYKFNLDTLRKVCVNPEVI